jgi:hypothetical protein
MTDITALTIAIVCLYSTGHWIGASFLVCWLLWAVIENVRDPMGIGRFVSFFRR